MYEDVWTRNYQNVQAVIGDKANERAANHQDCLNIT